MDPWVHYQKLGLFSWEFLENKEILHWGYPLKMEIEVVDHGVHYRGPLPPAILTVQALHNYTANVSPIKVTGKPRVTGGTP